MVDFNGKFKEAKRIDTQKGPWDQIITYPTKVSNQQGSRDILLPRMTPSYKKLSREECAELGNKYFPTYTYMFLYCSPQLEKISYLQPGMPFEATLMGLNKTCTTQDLWLDTNRIEQFQWHIIK